MESRNFRTSAFNSILKMHAGGRLHAFDGHLLDRGTTGNYWASDQFKRSEGEVLGFSQSSTTFGGK